jgi:hypothetical protein
MNFFYGGADKGGICYWGFLEGRSPSYRIIFPLTKGKGIKGIGFPQKLIIGVGMKGL